MTVLLRIWAAFVIAVKRLFAQKGLTIATLLGLAVTIALTLSIPLYADAVYFRVLREELAEGGLTLTVRQSRSPFAFMFRYIGDWHGVVTWEDIQAIDSYLSGAAGAELGLPRDLLVRYVKTENFRLFPKEDIAYADTKDPLAWVNFGFMSDVENQINLLEGSPPTVAEASPDSTVEVLISDSLATELGIQVGETLITFSKQTVEGVERTTQIPIRIAGVWQATDPTDAYWFYTPSTLDNLFLVPEETFLSRISPYMEGEVSLALWYLVMDGSNVHTPDAAPLLRRINAVQQQASALLPNTRLDVSPADALQRYVIASRLLTLLLYAFSVPILALLLTFVGLVVTLSVGRQRNQIAVLRSRGATTGQIIGIALLEGLLMGIIALLIGLPLGELLAELIGQTRSFLNFSNETDLRIDITTTTVQIGMVAVGLALAAQIGPTLGAARHTIVSYKLTQARALQAPWWQRLGLDILLLLPAGYGTYLLQQQQSIIVPGTDGAINSNPFQNPLLIIVPALGILALTLFFMRLLPYLMAFLAWIFSHFGGVGMLLAIRQLARTPGFYTGPMILLVLTLSLSTFTATLAQTLDNHLYDQMYYNIGADMNLADLGQDTSAGGSTPGGGGGGTEGSTLEALAEPEGPRWYFLPVSEYRKIDGVQGATRVGDYDAFTELSGARQSGKFLGVDRTEFPSIAYWRGDFAPSYLGEMMNALALTPDGILLPRDFMRQNALQVGDTIQLNVSAYGERAAMQMKVMGGFDYFPTWYPEEGPLFVGNLEYFFEQVGGQYPYHVWLRTQPGLPAEEIETSAQELKLRVLGNETAFQKIIREQQDPERQGLFGLLSVGFAAAALFTVLGFLLYALFSFRQRFIELGVLRAVGLSSGQMTIFLAWELAFLILTGIGLGTLLGVWASHLYIPSLQVGAGPLAQTPPFLVEIAWSAIVRIYALFGLLFLVALLVLATLLLRMKIFQAIKLGETV